MKLKFSKIITSTDIISNMFILSCVKILQDIIIYMYSFPAYGDIVKELLCGVLISDLFEDDKNKYINVAFHFPYAITNIEYINRSLLVIFREKYFKVIYK